MFHSYGDSIEEHQYDHKPVEPLRFNGVPDPKAKPFLRQPKTFAASLVRHFWFKISWNRVISVFWKTQFAFVHAMMKKEKNSNMEEINKKVFWSMNIFFCKIVLYWSPNSFLQKHFSK